MRTREQVPLVEPRDRGRERGDADHYGHFDLLLGTRLPVFQHRARRKQPDTALPVVRSSSARSNPYA